jgi:hypothetical protein
MLPARGQNLYRRPGSQHRLGDLAACLQDVLAVVKDDQRVLMADVLRGGLDECAARWLPDAEGVADRAGHLVG